VAGGGGNRSWLYQAGATATGEIETSCGHGSIAVRIKAQKIMQRKTVVIGVAASCVAVGLGTWVWLREQPSIQYRTAIVGHGDIDTTVSATGNPNAVVTVQVGSQVAQPHGDTRRSPGDNDCFSVHT